MMDQLLLKLSHPRTTITEETKSNRNGRRDELVSLCYSEVNYARCSQLMLEERPQIWGCFFRAWETTVTEEHTHTDVQTLAHSCTLCHKIHSQIVFLRTTQPQIVCSKSWNSLANFLTNIWNWKQLGFPKLLHDLKKPPGCQCQL